jgi:hypothetical protein
MLVAILTLSCFATGVFAETPLVYINKNLGFNVEGYKYGQSEFPCNIDTVLVQNLIERSKAEGIRMESVATADKIRNGVIPVLAIDIEQLVLGENFRFGAKGQSNLPRVQVTAALVTGKGDNDFVMAKHSCAIATLNELTPSSNVLDLGTVATVCSATHKCLRDLSKDIVQWIAPQMK